MSNWKEIRCSYLDEADRFWRVDAWETEDDTEPGKVIAYIDDLTRRVLYIDPLARTDSYAQEVISAKLDELKSPVSLEKHKSGTYSLTVETPNGTIIAEAEPGIDNTDECDQIYVGMQLCDDPYVYVDLASVQVVKDNGSIIIHTWDDITDEDYKHAFVIEKEEIDDAIDACLH